MVRGLPTINNQVETKDIRRPTRATTPAVTKAELCTPKPTRSDQTEEGSPPQAKAIIRDNLTLDETKVPEKEPYNPGLNKTTGVQGLNYTVDYWYTKDGSIILPLGLETRRAYHGDRALPDHLLQALQIQPMQAKEKDPLTKPYIGQEDLVSLFDDWTLAIHEAIPDMHEKKKVLCSKLQQVPELHPCLSNTAQYELSRKYSYIRLVHECRWRLTRDQNFAVKMYQTCKQRDHEGTMEYIDRTRKFRLRASGPYQGKWPCDTWEEYLKRVTSGLINGPLAAIIEEEKPQDTENLWGIINREENKVKRDQSPAKLEARYGSRLEDRYGDRKQKQFYTCKTRPLVKCFQCNQMGHVKKHCTLSVNISACQNRTGFREGSC